ncbi:MAG: sulfotransferase domain-containing protein [Rhodovibrionaceae bacterium]|nr:sulfotransferase domain-containing protein [Rhodovibrionaceae bacterium]
MSGGILWLASYPKSGNTWLRAFLAHYLRDAREAIAIDTLSDFAPSDTYWGLYERFSGRPRAEIGMEERIRMRPKLHEWLAAHLGETVAVKTHNCIGKEGETNLITPHATAGAIYVVRNPLDVAVSYAHHFDIEQDEAIRQLNNRIQVIGVDNEEYAPSCLGDWAGHVRSWMTAPGLRLHVLRYEDMHARPDETFASVVRFLEMPVEPERMKRAIELSDFKALRQQEQAGGFQEAPEGRVFFRTGKVGGWREVLSDAQAEAIVSHNGEIMRRLGYLDASGNVTV